MNQVLNNAVIRLKRVFPERPEVGLILGSGLGDFARQVENPVIVRYGDIPGYPTPTVEGHAGEFVQGYIGQVPVILARGRFHWYEGHPLETITLPVRIFAELGAPRMIVTNAAGSVNPDVSPGTFMLIDGFLDATFRSSPEIHAYRGTPWINESWIKEAQALAEALDINVTRGTFCWTSGPAYETPAEIDYFRSQGADAVGMSTLPEILSVSQTGLIALSISALTNFAAGITDQPLTHAEVMRTTTAIQYQFEIWMKTIIQHLSD
ncbi:MAG: purine-nucleoside phosphorylase [FCB group bacterium]|nr:purine-nucleoside phosphorylase [FCB group bacterium]